MQSKPDAINQLCLTDDAEINRLRTRLEQMEDEMTRLLNAVNDSAATFISKECNHSPSPKHTPPSRRNVEQKDEDDQLYSAEED